MANRTDLKAKLSDDPIKRISEDVSMQTLDSGHKLTFSLEVETLLGRSFSIVLMRHVDKPKNLGDLRQDLMEDGYEAALEVLG